MDSLSMRDMMGDRQEGLAVEAGDGSPVGAEEEMGFGQEARRCGEICIYWCCAELIVKAIARSCVSKRAGRAAGDFCFVRDWWRK